MKRSKALLVVNILTTLYIAAVIWFVGGLVKELGGLDYIEAWADYFELYFDMVEFVGSHEDVVFVLYLAMILFCVHMALFVLGNFLGWLSFLCKAGVGANFAATFYLLGTIACPVALLIGLPLTIVGYIGGKNQRKINKKRRAQQNEAQMAESL